MGVCNMNSRKVVNFRARDWKGLPRYSKDISRNCIDHLVPYFFPLEQASLNYTKIGGIKQRCKCLL